MATCQFLVGKESTWKSEFLAPSRFPLFTAIEAYGSSHSFDPGNAQDAEHDVIRIVEVGVKPDVIRHRQIKHRLPRTNTSFDRYSVRFSGRIRPNWPTELTTSV